jgi:hypothetical protein
MTDKIHPELLDQLKQAGTSPVQAVVELRPAHQPEAVPPADECAKLAHDVLSRVASEVGHPPARVNVMRHLARVALEADPEFLRSLLRQPEVVSAIPNKLKEPPTNPPPKGKRPA